jgi:exodeoxyribonuclease-5
MELTAAQQQAFEGLRALALGENDSKVGLLAGFAGTGKTTVVGELVRALVSDGLAVAVCAPTHKALRVLHDKIGDEPVEFSTLHSITGLGMDEHDDGTLSSRQKGRSDVENYDVLFADECSMIGSQLFTHVLRNRGACRIVFIGDPAQLPPVNDGAESPVFTHIHTRWTLNEIVRQAADNPMVQLGAAIRKRTESGQRMRLENMHEALPASGKAGIWPTTRDAVAQLTAQDWKDGRDSRVLAYRNVTVMQYNTDVHKILYPDAPHRFTVGEMVVVHEGNQTVHTNEECEVIAVQPGQHEDFPEIPALIVTLRRDGVELPYQCYTPRNEAHFERLIKNGFAEARALKASGDQFAGKRKAGLTWKMKRSLLALRHAYCMTVHKSQGSTFHTAYLDFTDVERILDPLEYNRALYVGCTRPSEHLAVVVA